MTANMKSVQAAAVGGSVSPERSCGPATGHHLHLGHVRQIPVCFGFGFALFLAACGGGGNGGNAAPISTSKPFAGSTEGSRSVDSAGSTVRSNSPFGVATDGVGNVHAGYSRNNTIRKITSFGVVSTLAGTAGVRRKADAALAAVASNPSNTGATVCQAAQGGAWSVASAAAVITGAAGQEGLELANDSAAYLSNIALKLCPPGITAPAVVKKDPDPPDPETPDAGCFATFRVSFNELQPDGNHYEKYENWFGAPPPWSDWVSKPSWGDLGRPAVYHFNTDAQVRAIDPATNDEIQVDSQGNIRLPVGYNTIEWRADATLGVGDIAPLFLIPAVVNGLRGETKAFFEASPKLGVSFAKEATDIVTGAKIPVEVEKLLPKVLREAGSSIAVDAGIRGLNPLGEYRVSEFFASDVDVLKNQVGANADFQQVWVYDNDPPTLQANTDPNTFPPNLQPLVSYDPSTGTYYVEATGPGIPDGSVQVMAQSLLKASDKCQGNRPALVPFRVTGAASTPAVWHPGDSGTFEWQVQDSGPNQNGQPNSSGVLGQKFEVRDTHPPVLLAPQSKVVEIALNTSSTVALGMPSTFDLADFTPTVGNSVGNSSSITVTQPGIITITWTAVDASGNSVQQQQLINVKLAGTNTAPVANDQSVNAVSFNPIDIVLTGHDADVDSNTGRHDPLSFAIKSNPAHGHFIAPLVPYFIDDYRLGPASLRFAGNPQQSDPITYCTSQSSSFSGSWQMQYPYNASWITVDDDGTTVVYDQGNINCFDQGIDFANAARLAMFDVNGNLVRAATTGDIVVNAVYMNSRTKGIYIAYDTDPGTGDIVYFDKNFNRLGSFSTTGRSNPSENVANPKAITADNQGIVYFANINQIAAYQGPTSATTLTTDNSYKFLGMIATSADPNITGTIKSMATDSQGNLYISMDNRVLKYKASTISTDPTTGQATFVPGTFVGWLGRCDSNLTNTTNACDTVKLRSLGFACSDSLCGVPNGSSGADAGQFNDTRGVAVDPHDLLYVSDHANLRIERFTSEGDFAGQAESTGAGYGFILGDFGNPVNITVNSDHLYILNNQLLHSLRTDPVTPVDDSSARVTYQSDNNFVGTDTFSFNVSDGLATGSGNVTVNVSRNHRPPEVSVPPRYSFNEGASINVTLVGTDPDGSLDTLSYSVVTQPQHGKLLGTGANLVYTPDPYYNGTDSFTYVVNDGLYNSAPATVALTINPVQHPPQVTTPATDAEGLGFGFQFPIDVFDPDANESLQVTVDWLDGSPVDVSGVVLDQNGHPIDSGAIQSDGTLPSGMTTTGPVVNLSGDGNGKVTFQHAYATTGDHVALICATDRMQTNSDGTQQPTAGSQATCTHTTFAVSLKTDLLMHVTSAPDHAQPGAASQFAIMVTARPFDVTVPGYPRGLDASNVVVNGENGSDLSFSGIAASQGGCTSKNGAFRCALGGLANGASATVTVADAIYALTPGNARLSVTANRQADAVPLLDNDAGGVVTIDPSGNPPVTIALSKTAGGTAGGRAVTISGHDFDALAHVRFGNVSATDVQVVDSSKIALTTPAHAAGAVDVVVTNSDGQESVMPQAFSYVASNPNSGGGGWGCSISRDAENDPFDPTFYLLLIIASAYLLRRRYAGMA